MGSKVWRVSSTDRAHIYIPKVLQLLDCPIILAVNTRNREYFSLSSESLMHRIHNYHIEAKSDGFAVVLKTE